MKIISMKNKYLLLTIIGLLLSSFAYRIKRADKVLTGDYVLVPTGKINNEQVSGFYISTTEVSNKQYREFLDDLKKKGETDKLNAAMVDTVKWRDFIVHNEPYVNYYFQNKAYNDYPVVNISKRGAELYALWLTEKYNQSANEKARFALPTEAQWMLAAQGGSTNAVYGWKGNSLKNEQKGRWYGGNMGNYRVEQNGRTGSGVDNPNADVTAPVKSFLPNAYGIYNMSGNVAEMVADKGYSKGGSWYSKADKLKIDANEEYPSGGSPAVGFRLIMLREGAK